MKKLLIIAIAAISFTACKSKTDTTTTNKDLLLLNDSSNLNNGSYLTDTGIAVNGTKVPDTVREVIVTPPVTHTRVIYKNAPSNGYSSNNNTSSSSNSTTRSTSSTQRRGLSKGAKGAIIGGVGGAVGGAIIGKNVKGAAIGAAVGAAGGYIIGHSKDKKDGRIQ